MIGSSTTLRPSTVLSHGFSLFRIRSTRFRSRTSDSTPFQTPRHLQQYAHVAFAMASSLKRVNLAAGTHSLPRFSKRTPRHCNRLLVLQHFYCFLRDAPFAPWLTYSNLISGSCSPRSRGTFQLSVTVLLRYRTSLVFRVGS